LEFGSACHTLRINSQLRGERRLSDFNTKRQQSKNGALMMSSSSTSPDFSAEHSVDKLMQRWLRAHDAGDAEAMLELYVEDADYVSIDGQAITGRNAIIDMYSQIFAATKGNQAKISRHRRRILGGTVVVDDGAWEVNGELPPGAPKDGLYTTVFEQRDGEWKIAAARSYILWSGPTAQRD
jgi:uncharacterized protein (TIGR02246 family)